MSDPIEADYRWLTGEAAEPWLALAASGDVKSPRLTSKLRGRLTPNRTHLVLSQIALRRRAAGKFRNAARMFFTDKGLQQASDETLAAYKASHILAGSVADLCSGIGGDLMALAARGPVEAYELDPICAQLARTNTRVVTGQTVRVHMTDCLGAAVQDFDAWHIDPDRRGGGRRHAQPQFYKPGPEQISALLRRNPNGLIKLAPAALCPHSWQLEAQLEWVGYRRTCQQLLARFGNLTRSAGQRQATILHDGAPPRSVSGSPNTSLPIVNRVQRYLYEPHAAVLAAQLTGAVGAEQGISRISPGLPYLTGDRAIRDPAMACFVVHETLPLDVKRIRGYLRQRGIGRLEIKRRGTHHDPARVRRQLSLHGDRAATLLILPVRGHVRAVCAHRLEVTRHARVDPRQASQYR